MISLARIPSIASCMVLATASSGHADSTKIIDRNVLRQMVQLSVAYTQARISFTSPPYPVQFVNTSPFAATAQARTSTTPVVNPGVGLPINNFLLLQAQRLAPGNYNVSANTMNFTLTNLNTGSMSTNPIPTNVVSLLPSNSTSGAVNVRTNAGVIHVTYSFKR